MPSKLCSIRAQGPSVSHLLYRTINRDDGILAIVTFAAWRVFLISSRPTILEAISTPGARLSTCFSSLFQFVVAD